MPGVPWHSLCGIAGATAVLGLLFCVPADPAPGDSPPPADSPSASASASPPAAAPSHTSAPPPRGTPTITLGFDDGTADHFAVAKMLDRLHLKGVFYVNSGRLDNPKYLTMNQVRQMQRDGHEIGGHTVYHLHLAQQDSAEQKRQVCADRDQLLAAGIHATDFAYPFNEFGKGTESLARACGYESARTTDGIGCRVCPLYESLNAGDRYNTRALSGFGPATTAGDLIGAVTRIAGTNGWLQMVFHRICTTSCPVNSVRVTQFVRFARWLAKERDAGAVRNATVRQALHGRLQPRVGPPAATATTLAFQNGSLEQPGHAPGGPPRCFAYGGLGEQSAVSWRTVTNAHQGRLALQARITRASAGIRLTTMQDLGSCAPPIVAGGHYRIGFWYQATKPIKTATYARQPRGGYQAFGSARFFPASRTWALASWIVGPAPDRADMALSLSVQMNAAGVYTFDELSLAYVPDRGKHAHRRPETGTAADQARGAGDAFTPADANPLLPDAERQRVGNDMTGPPGWFGYLEVAAALMLAFAAVVTLDRRFRHLHRRTRLQIPTERRSDLQS
jgi:peptidoglycan/xylan/chitin deacetylase (PgdA/CDA1 family)